MRRAVWLIVLALVVAMASGCAAEDPLVRSMHGTMRQSAGIVMGTIGQGRSFFEEGNLITWYPVTVERSNVRGLDPGTVLRVYRDGGTVLQESAEGNLAAQKIVDDMVLLPPAEGKVFLVLEAEGDRLYIKGGLPVENGRITVNHPFRDLFQSALQALPQVS
jgi:hypothetical protein